VRLAAPQPFEDLGHTADAGVRVRGATAEEALGRLVLAMGSLLSGGAPVTARREVAVEVAGGPGLAGSAVALLRELLYLFVTERVAPAACDVLRVDEGHAEARVALGSLGPEHGDGLDLKAVTRHATRLEPDPEQGGWIGQVVFDV